MQHFEQAGSRRDFLCRAGGGFGAIALYGLLAQEGLLPSQQAAAAPGANSSTNPARIPPVPRT